MDKNLKNFMRIFSNLVLGSRRNTVKSAREIAKKTKNKKILEIGSGKKVKGKYPYSVAHFFNKNNEVVMSDINPDFGHRVIDATKMNFREEFDMIICLNVLEHVYNFEKAIGNIHRALKKDGEVAVFVPFAYPLHDEPYDFYRFSEHSLRKMFSEFREVKIRHFGLRQMPTAYFLNAKK
jgi:ubiquinone/menaquinone biosynthesis C-methylase UbiE